MSTTSRGSRRRTNSKSLPILLLELLIVINYAEAIDYAAYRADTIPREITRESARTTRAILEELNNRSVSPTGHDLQDGTEHLLEYGALLRAQILDTFGKLVYDHYDDFSMSQIEALYRIYRETLERKYNIFDIVPSVLEDPDTRPTKICAHINARVRTCLKESSSACMNVKIHDEPHRDTLSKPALNVTRHIYRLAEIAKNYPNGFSLKAVLSHLRARRLRFTPALFSGLLHNVQYDNFDDRVRTAERELVIFLTREPKDFSKISEKSYTEARSVSAFLKNYLSNSDEIFHGKAKQHAAYLAEHVVRQVDAVSENIELLGTVYDNSTINLQYLFELILPNDSVDRDVAEARDYLLREILKKNILNTHLRVEKYQQAGPDQLLMEIFGQLRDIKFAEDLVTSLHIHARYWHKSHMVENLNELLELFDAYENLRGIPAFVGIMEVADKIKSNLRDSKNVTVELLCSRPRACLRIGLEIVSNCSIVNDETKKAIELFIERTTCGCSCLHEDSTPELVLERESTTKDPAEIDNNETKTSPSSDVEESPGNHSTGVNSVTESLDTSTESNSSPGSDDDYSYSEEEIPDSEYDVEISEENTSPTLQVDDQITGAPSTILPGRIIDETATESPCEGADCLSSKCNGTDCSQQPVECTGSDCSTVECNGNDCPTQGNCTGDRCGENECEGPQCQNHETAKDNCVGTECDVNGTKVNCTGTDCPVNTKEIPGSCEDGKCATNSTEVDDCTGPDCPDIGSCEDGLCDDSYEIIECKGDECSSSCEGDDCEDYSEQIPDVSVNKNECQGTDCSDASCEGENCRVNGTLVPCEGADCPDSSITTNCEGPNCPTSSCAGEGCKENASVVACEGPDCPETAEICEGPDCPVSAAACEGPDCPATATPCEGPDCPATAEACEGPDCPATVAPCEGPDCPATAGACEGPDCPATSGACEGPDCPATAGACEGPDCPATVAPCEGPDCPATSGACEGPDCPATAGACEGPDCPATARACEGPDCPATAGACEGPDCPATSGTCEGPDCPGTAGTCEGPDCPVTVTPCEGPDCPVNATLCEGPECPATVTPCEGSDCPNNDCSGPDCSIASTVECQGPECPNYNCTGENCLVTECEGSDCPEIPTTCTGDNCLLSTNNTICSGPDCLLNSTKVDCKGADCPTETLNESCEDGDCFDDKSDGEICEGSSCSENSSVEYDCEGASCDGNSMEINCEGSNCSESSVELCEGPDCEYHKDKEHCKGPDCPIGEKEVKIDCEGTDCPQSKVEKDCEGQDCPNSENDTKIKCEGPDCPIGIFERDCEGPDCPMSFKNSEEDCEGADCPRLEEVSENLCKGDECLKKITGSCTGGNCPTNIAPPTGERNPTKNTETSSISTSPIIEILRPNRTTTFCDNSDPHYRRKLYRLLKMRRIDADSSTPRTETRGAIFEFSRSISEKANATETMEMDKKQRGKNPLLQVLGSSGSNSRRSQQKNSLISHQQVYLSSENDGSSGSSESEDSLEILHITNRTAPGGKNDVSTEWEIDEISDEKSNEESKMKAQKIREELRKHRNGMAHGGKKHISTEWEFEKISDEKSDEELKMKVQKIREELKKLRNGTAHGGKKHMSTEWEIENISDEKGEKESKIKAQKIRGELRKLRNGTAHGGKKHVSTEWAIENISDEKSDEESKMKAQKIREELRKLRTRGGGRVVVKETVYRDGDYEDNYDDDDDDVAESSDDLSLEEILSHRGRVGRVSRKVQSDSWTSPTELQRAQKWKTMVKARDGDSWGKSVDSRIIHLPSEREKRVLGSGNRRVSRRVIKLRTGSDDARFVEHVPVTRHTDSRRSDLSQRNRKYIIRAPKRPKKRYQHKKLSEKYGHHNKLRKNLPATSRH